MKRERSRQREIIGILLFIIGIFLLISLLSYIPGRALPQAKVINIFSKSFIPSLRWMAQKNYGGYLGAIFSYYLFNLFGVVAFIFPLLFFLWGLNRLRTTESKIYLYNSIFIGSTGIIVSMFLSKFNKIIGKFDIGGIVGKGLNKGFIKVFGKGGGLIIEVSLLIILLLLFTNINFKKGMVFLIRLFKNLLPKPMERKPQIERPQPVKVEKKIPVERPEEEKVEWRVTPEDLLSLLHKPEERKEGISSSELKREEEILLKKLKEFGIEGRISEITSGPVITRFEFEPAPGVKIHKIESLSNDLALSLKAERIRILAPIPGKSAVGIEIPNRERRIVYLSKILNSDIFKKERAILSFGVGETITGEPYIANIQTMPHLLIAGTTGSGKSVCINTIITSIISKSSYKIVRFITIDPKRLELPVYNPIPHLLAPTVVDPKEAVKRLEDAILIMETRYRDFARAGVRNIEGYNELAERKGIPKKPYILIIIDELADLMLTAPGEIEGKITRLAQMSRAVGIHLVLATQRPSVDVITGLIKANFPARIAFQVASKTDSRTILDMNGAESLLGQGDMLFLPPGKGEPVRLHGAYLSIEEIKRIVERYCRNYLETRLREFLDPQTSRSLVSKIMEQGLLDVFIEPEGVGVKEKRERLYDIIPKEIGEAIIEEGYYPPLPESEKEILKEKKASEMKAGEEVDEFFIEAAKLVIRHKEASVSMLQRRLDVGWARAGRIIDQLEKAGIVGPYVGSKARKVLIESEEELERILKKIR